MRTDLCPEFTVAGVCSVPLTCDRPWRHLNAHHDNRTDAEWWLDCPYCGNPDGKHRPPCIVIDGVLVPPPERCPAPRLPSNRDGHTAPKPY